MDFSLESGNFYPLPLKNSYNVEYPCWVLEMFPEMCRSSSNLVVVVGKSCDSAAKLKGRSDGPMQCFWINVSLVRAFSPIICNAECLLSC